MEQTTPKNKPVNTDGQPPLFTDRSPVQPPVDPKTLERLGDENQEELRQQREEEADKRDHWSDV